MYRFMIENGSIINEKHIDIGTERIATFFFDFSNTEFQNQDIFELILGENTFSNYSFIPAGKMKFVSVNLDFIEAEQTVLEITIKKNNQAILSDSLTVTASIPDIDLSDYYTKQETDGLFNNKLALNQTDNSNDVIAISYNEMNLIEKVNLTSNSASLTINPCTGYSPVSGKVPTFELWLIPSTTKTAISVSNSIQVIGEIPEQLTAGNCFVFVFRFIGSKQLLNFSHSFSIESGSSSSN